nr:DUF1206 domain-containing protein [Petropleomorpha daqingensis]
MRHLASLGFTGYGLLHLLVAWLAVELAWGPRPDGGATTDSAGALAVLRRSPAGPVLLWVLAVGLGGLALWQAVEVVRHHRRLPEPGPERRKALLQVVKTVGTALLYGFLAVSAARAAVSGGRGRATERATVRGVLGWPGGQELVVAVGVVVVGIGIYLVRKGLRSDFVDEIDLESVSSPLRALTRRCSQVGFVLKGVALVLVGGVVAWAAATFDPARATGLDGAMQTLAAEPYGQWMLTAIAAGLASFCVYCLARARHPVG